ncbi:Ff.00g016210.m01.CDS01 [Fusarium sp. VM40]|nr:Ff.00g016210.m01.CDS01 [Fusarium sp. VM40]
MPEPASPNPTASQSERHGPGKARRVQNNPKLTEDNHDAIIGDQSPLTTSQQVNLWQANIEGPDDHKDTAEDDAAKDDSLCGGSKLTPLHKLLQNTENDDDAIHELRNRLDEWKDIIDCSPEDEETALHMAAREGLLKTASQLLKAGAGANTRNGKKESPLHLACLYGHQQLVKKLLKEGADPELEDEDGLCPLHSAVAQDFEAEVIKELLGPKGRIINKAVGSAQWTALNKAIYYEREGVVDVLLQGGARLDIKDADGWTPLMTAVKERQFNAFEKLLKHLDENQISLEVVNAPDNGGMTPLMQLISWEPEQDVTDAIEHLLEFKPDVDVTDRHARTALHYAMDYPGYWEGILSSTSLVRRLARSLTADKLLQIDKYGETAFDVAFDEEGKCPRPAFELLLKDLVDRVAQSDKIEEPLCWATYRLERHTIAQQIFQKRYTTKETSPNHLREKHWGIIEWAIHARLPRVLQTYLRALGMERRTIGEDEIHKSIENGRELIREMKKEVQQPFTPAVEGKRKKEERGPPNGSDGQALRDLEDILDYLYPEKGEKLTNSLEISRPDKKMQETLKDFSAAIIQSNFVKFRTIQEVLYDVNSMEHIQDNVQRLKRFDFHPKDSSEQASETVEADSETEAQFTWIHLPSNNIDYLDGVKKILKQEHFSKREADKVASFLRRSWIEIPDRKSTSRFMRPRYVSNKADLATKGHEDAGDVLKDTGERGSSQTGLHSRYNEHRASDGSSEKDPEGEQCNPSGDNSVRSRQEEEGGQTNDSGNIENPVEMPYLYFSTYHQSESHEQVEPAALPSEPERRVLAEINMRQKLFEAYKNRVIHRPTTLDEFYYQFSSDKDSIEDRNLRNRDQVVTKYLRCGDSEEQRHWPLLRVSQLWVWTIDEKWLITSTSCATNDIRDNLVTDILEHLRRQVENGSRRIGPTSASEMSRVIVDYCIGTYDRKRRSQIVNLDRDQPLRAGGTTTGNQYRANTIGVNPNTAADEKRIEERSIHQIFSDSINEIGRKESSLFGLSYGRHDRSREPETGPGAGDTSKMMEDLKNALKTVSEQLRHIKDIRDELNILMSIAKFQRKVQSTMTKSQPVEDLSSDYLLRDIKELDRFADQTQEAVKTTLSLQESEIANLQASESVKQGKVVLIFTLITVWFLPLSFLTSLFALDVESFMKAPAWALYIIFLVPFIFLGSAVAYVWKTKIRGILGGVGAPADVPSNVDDQGTSTARPIPSKISYRKHKNRDEESGVSPSE